MRRRFTCSAVAQVIPGEATRNAPALSGFSQKRDAWAEAFGATKPIATTPATSGQQKLTRNVIPANRLELLTSEPLRLPARGREADPALAPAAQHAPAAVSKHQLAHAGALRRRRGDSSELVRG
jgi:hypothetical protein